jgi:hypothetical protein
MTHCIKGLFAKVHTNDSHHNNTAFTLDVVMHLQIVILSVIILNLVMLSVAAP